MPEEWREGVMSSSSEKGRSIKAGRLLKRDPNTDRVEYMYNVYTFMNQFKEAMGEKRTMLVNETGFRKEMKGMINVYILNQV